MRKLPVLLILIGLASVFGISPYLDHLYAATHSTVADSASGNIYLHHIRGGPDVHINQAEHWASFGAFAGGILLAVLGGFLLERSRRKADGSAA